MENEKLPLGIDLRVYLGEPFVVELSNGRKLIVQTEGIRNIYGDLVYCTEKVINEKPTEEEVFKVKLKNPDFISNVDWNELYPATRASTKAYTAKAYPPRQDDS